MLGFSVVNDDYEMLRESLEKLQLNDASLILARNISGLRFWFRCGFLGMLHLEIIQERLEREFNMTVIATVPNVSYIVRQADGEEHQINNPSDYQTLVVFKQFKNHLSQHRL